MAAKIRSVDFLPEIFQTPVNKQFLEATLDQLIQEPNYKQTQGYIGRKVGPGVNANDSYVVEPTKVRNDYQLEPGVVSLDPTTSKLDDVITYPGILDALSTQGGIVNKADRLFESEYYAWDPFVDFDKFNNYAQYYWLPQGPEVVPVAATVIPTEQTFTVTRANGAYTFTGYKGKNPTLSLARTGSYKFIVAQNNANSIDYRVTNDGTSSWNINYDPNPTLTLTRGNTYTWNLQQSGPYKFYIKTQESFGTTNVWSEGVTNNGAYNGIVSFTVPQDAPDVLYYCNDIEFNLRGQMNIIDAQPGDGPKFWIQTQPGISGVLPWSPNISDRDVLGVVNNGTDLGTVTFNVPNKNAQSFYTSMPLIGSTPVAGKVDLLVPPTLTYEQINGISVQQFLEANPTGIDGITNLNNRTLVFITQTASVAPGGWYNNTPFDPLAPLSSSTVGGFDTTAYSESTPVADPAVQFSLWQIQYINDANGVPFIKLNSILAIDNLSQFSVAYGKQYVNTNWYKNAQGYFVQTPLLTATLPYLFYQDGEDPSIFGEIKLIDLTDGEAAAYINVDTDILGQPNYISPNGVTFTNGLKVIFQGDVIPSSYQDNVYYVQGVGTGIVLVPEAELLVPETYADEINGQPLVPDYMTINIASPDRNPWSRSNRWFHVDVIDAAAAYNKVAPDFTNAQRARRPILEFRAGIDLFNFGTQGIPPVNIIDFTQTDALLTVNGSLGFGSDGYNLIQDSLVIFAADNNPIVRSTVYQVDLIVTSPGAAPIIDLIPTSYSPVLADQTTVCLNGNTEIGQSFYFNGSNWISTQQKTSVNQPPLFDVYDINGYSFGDQAVYPSSNFTGCKLLSYAENPSNPVDDILGIPLSFFSLDNIGDILFTNNLYTDTFVYTPLGAGITVDVSSGFVREYSDRVTFTREIGWQTAAIPSLARQQFQFTYDGNPLQLDILAETNLNVPAVQIFINDNYQLPSTYTLSINANTNTTLITLNGTGFVIGDIVEVLVYSEQVSSQAFYEVPINLENNPFNGNSLEFSLGTVRSHYATICENLLTLEGPINGRNNTRDLGNILIYGTQILQQSSPLTLAGYFLRSPSYDIFSSIEYNSREYIKYKSKLLTAVTQLDIEPGQTVSSILEQAIYKITQNLTSTSSFYWSDMLPVGINYTTTTTVVNPITTAVFNTTQTYDFTSSNYLGLLVYVNNVLLLRNTQYVVSPDAPKLTILIPLNVGDVVTINEYPTTVGNWCPNTPSKMGLYPKWTPEIFLDETYTDADGLPDPTVVIQGHDGSITIAFGDIRDQVLLEFEKRIYDNIKVDDNPIPMTTDEVNPTFYPAQTTALLPGFFRKTPYTFDEINQILSESFLSWVGQNKVDYTQQNYQPNNEFSYNYSSAANRINQQPFQQGNWRGIYRYFYDTETPATTPWEMLGFTEEPLWWMERYGPAPYTSGNTVLWDDLEAGLIVDPAGPYILPEYARPGLSKVIPAGPEGALLSPLDCVVGLSDPYGFQQSWVAGDGGPVQASWWNSSSYPFTIMRLLALTKPAQFFSLFADRDLYRYDTTIGQYLLNGRYRLNASGVQVYGNGVSKASYINWIVDYNRQSGLDSTTELTADLANLDVRLCYRMASFSDPVYVQLFNERGGPNSTNSSLVIPPNSYDLVFYKNQPFNQITYSSIIVQVDELANGNIGYTVYGYSNVQPYFEILVSSPAGLYQTISAGDITVQVPAQFTTNVTQIPYGYTFTNPASVCNFILGYGAWLESQGLVFDDIYNGYVLNWGQMAQEFLYFGSQGWEPGTMINLNPCATTIKASQPISIVDTIASVTPENMLLDQNRQVLDVRNMIVNRSGNSFSVTTTTGQTINFLTLKFTNYEDMVVLNNITQYNDLIYDPITGSRQIRLSLIASTTTEWDGQLDAQGFILNLNNVKEWQSYQKYTKGEIVLYKNTYWQAIDISEPQQTFNYNDWAKSNYQLIDNGLLPNLANKADQLTISYDVYRANLTSDNDLFAFGLIGFRPRQYMTDMNLNAVTQVQLYQQFLGTKGSLNAAEIFNIAQLNKKESGAYQIYENWGILSGTYGAQANKSYFEIQLNEALLSYNPSTIQIIVPGETSQANQSIYLNDLWRESYNITSPEILPTVYENSKLATALPTAGYVCLDDVDVTVFSIEDPSAIDKDIDNIGIGTYIWIAKTNSYDWGVYRVASIPGQIISMSDNLNSTSQVQFNQVHGLDEADLIIIKYFNQGVNGVYRVLSVPTPSTILVAFSFNNTNLTTITGSGLGFKLQTARVSQASDIATLPFVNSLIPGAKVWVDNDGEGHWETLEKQTPFVANSTIVPGLNATARYGSSIAQTRNNFIALVGAPGASAGVGILLSYFRGTLTDYQFDTQLTLTATGTANYGNMVTFGNSNWAIAGANTSSNGVGYATIIYRNSQTNELTTTQLLVPPDQNFNPIGFGTSGAISTNEHWLYIGAPGANIVYAYEKVEVIPQSVSYTTDGATTLFEYDTSIQINYLYPEQLIVTIEGQEAVLGVEYSVSQNYVVFGNPPPAGQNLVITRRLETQLDTTVYYGVQPQGSFSSGTGVSFTVQNTRGAYLATLTAAGQNYSIGDTLIIYGTQLGGASPTNNLTITVTNIVAGGLITGYTTSGTGVVGSSSFALNTYLYNATNIYNFTVRVNNVLQRPFMDYTFNPTTTNISFLSGSIPGTGSKIVVTTPTYWQYVTSITSPDSLSGDMFGQSVATTTNGRQIIVGASNAETDSLSQAGKVYVFDRSAIRYLVSDITQMIYTVPGNVTGPVAVSVNGTTLLTIEQSLSGQYTVNGNNITFSNIKFTSGDVIEIGTNQITQIQQLVSDTPSYEAKYGSAVVSCPLNCSVYVGAPFDSTYVAQAGSVDHQVNQSRVYGVITSTIANPDITPGGTLRINDTVVTVPTQPNNTVEAFAAAINAAMIPNVIASATPDLEFVGDGTNKVFNIGTLYTAASSYTTVVYVNNILQTSGVDYSYDPNTENIYFVYAPISNSVILVISGRLTIGIQNIQEAEANRLLTVLPGVTASVFDQLGFDTFVFTQQILSPAPTFYGLFGSSISIDSNAINLIVGSPNGNVYEPTTFDASQTYFDENSTTFYNPINNGGVAYTYDYFPSNTNNINNPGQFAFGQQIYNSITEPGDAFGTAVSYVTGRLLVGALGGVSTDTVGLGYTTVYDNPTNIPAWTPIRTQQPVVDVYAIDGVFSYNGTQSAGVNVTVGGSTQTYFDFFDPLQGKILGIARSNLNYIGAVDPAQYNTGSVHNNGQAWGSEHIGEMWWDTDTVRFIDPNQDDIVYASRRWGQTFPGSRVDIYQWVESTNPPAGYTGQGTPLSTISYTVGSSLGQNNIFTTLYYFWVRSITTIATGSGKTLSASGVASYITDPRSSGLPYIAGINASTIAIYNAQKLLDASNTILSIGFDRQLNDDVVHQQYQIVTDGIADSFLTPQLYRKLLDSFCGIDTGGNAVPDPSLSPGMRYGVQFRPRQSMFADRFTALENYLGRANAVMAQFPISESRRFNLLNSAEPIPPSSYVVNPTPGLVGAYMVTNWNTEVPNLEVLGYQNLNSVPVGYKYLVVSDSNQEGRWTIYQVLANKTLGLIRVQSYDTTLYWYYVNWYLLGYNSSVSPVAAVQNYGQLSTLTYKQAPVGSSVRVIANGAGKWEIYLRTGLDPAKDWQRVGLEDGTIAFSEELWNYQTGNFGFDAEVFDAQYYDETPQIETRYILRALNEEIYIEDLQYERNSSLILMFNYVYSEFIDPSWLVKTSYVDVNHNIRALAPYQTYLPDNQDFVLKYFQEVKPYHVQVRQFNLIYTGEDDFLGDLTDYDLPAYWKTDAEIPQFVSPILTPYTEAITTSYSTVSDTAPDAQIWLYPSLYSEWFNNYLLSVEGATVVNRGAGYSVPPVVTVTGPCVTPATMEAVINGNGQVVAINIVNPGSGYSGTAIITISGGGLPATPTPWVAGAFANSNSYIINSSNQIYFVAVPGFLGNVEPLGTGTVINGSVTLNFTAAIAQAVAQMGNPLVRSFKTVMKYDRYEYQTSIIDWTSGTTYEDGTQVRYDNLVWQAVGTVTNDVFDPEQYILVDANTLSGVNRTMGYYVSTPNTPGLSLPLLIDGLEYPGVQVAAVTFDQNTGFDVGNYSINVFDNFSFDASGKPTYDVNILDTIFESSYLDLYLGTRPSDINVSGGAYVDAFESHAPEELVPGIEFDTLDLRVYTTPGADWLGEGHGFPQSLVQDIYNRNNPTISFAGQLPYPINIEITDATQGYDLNEGTDYTVDWPNQTFTIINTSLLVNNGDQLGVYVYELGGGNQLYKNVYNGADVGDTITVPVQYDQIFEFAIFVNGNYLDSSNYSYIPGLAYSTTTITFTSTYTVTDFISLVAIGPTTVDNVTTDYSWSVPVTQSFTATAGQLVFNLTNSLEYTNSVNAIVTVNGVRARTAAGIDHLGDGTTTIFGVAQRLGFPQNLITSEYVNVYFNDILQLDSTYTVNSDVAGTTITFNTAPADGIRIYIAVTYGTQAVIDPVAMTLTFNPAGGLVPIPGAIVSATTFNDTREQRLLTQVFVGPVVEGITINEAYDSTEFDNPPGTASNNPGLYDAAIGATISVNNFDLTRLTTDIGRPWVTLNGKTLTPYVDYTIVGTELILTRGAIQQTDVLMITQITNSVVPEAMEFRIFQDMRGVQATYRMTPSTTTTVTQPVSMTTDIIYVDNIDALSIPNFNANVWGVVTIDGERIMYRYRGIATKSTDDSALGQTLFLSDYVPYVSPYKDNVSVTNNGVVVNPADYTVIGVDVNQKISEDKIIGVQFNTAPAVGRIIAVTVTMSNAIFGLLRGTAGTAADSHAVGALVYDMGRGNLLAKQYQDYIESQSFMGNGTTVRYEATDLDLNNAFDEAQGYSNTEFDVGSTTGEPGSYDYGLGDASLALEVYVGGTRQIGNYEVIQLGYVIVLFDTPPADGSEVTFVIRRGVTWYNPGLNTPSDGVPLQETNNPAALFLRGLN